MSFTFFSWVLKQGVSSATSSFWKWFYVACMRKQRDASALKQPNGNPKFFLSFSSSFLSARSMHSFQDRTEMLSFFTQMNTVTQCGCRIKILCSLHAALLLLRLLTSSSLLQDLNHMGPPAFFLLPPSFFMSVYVRWFWWRLLEI